MPRKKSRVACFVDGFNLYHAIADLGMNYLKWLDLRKLMETFCDPVQHRLVSIWYFTAHATWLPGAYKRHREYIKALKAVGVRPVVARFKEKSRRCANCGAEWTAHEEKESDVNLALWIVNGAHRDEYDRAHIVTADSDLVPAVKELKRNFPEKKVRILLPPNRICHDLAHLVGKKYVSNILPFHVERCLLPGKILDSKDKLVARRPKEYKPPWRKKR